MIPFNRAAFAGRELEYMAEAVVNRHLAGDGPFTKRCHALLEELMPARKALLTTSCTHALEMSALLLDIKPGDEVIVPSFTFVSSVNAFVLRGARPVFADIRPDTLNLDERLLEGLITPRTRAIVVVHYAGVGCEMDVIGEIAARHGIPVIEDNAHGLFGTFRGRQLGTFGALATQSFHETKNITCGEGGALIINDESLIERAEILREKGTDRSRFFRGQVDKYTWVDMGSSYLPSDILAAYLYGQLEARDAIQSCRAELWSGYERELKDWAHAVGIATPVVPGHCQHPNHLYYLLLPSLEARTAFIAHLKREGVQSVFHYVSLHLSPMGRSWGYKEGDCPVTEAVSDHLVRLPLHTSLTAEEQAHVCKVVRAFKP